MTTQPTDDERLTKCVNVCAIRRRMCDEYYWDGIHWCHATERTVRPLGCPTAERTRKAHWDSIHTRRINVGLSAHSTTARHRESEEASNYENDAQTICFDCESTHQLSCLCFGQNGVPDDCPTYNARRIIINATSRYDIQERGLSNVLKETERWIIPEENAL